MVKHLISVMGVDMFNKLAEVMKGDSRAKQEFCLERVNTLDAMKRKAVEAADECCTLSDLAVKGGDLEAIGLSGREIGSALEKALDMVIDEELPNEKEAILEAVQRDDFLSEDTEADDNLPC